MNSVCPTPTITSKQLGNHIIFWPFCLPTLIWQQPISKRPPFSTSKNESKKSICQHCGSHFDYLVTELTDMLKVFEGGEQTMTENVLCVFNP